MKLPDFKTEQWMNVYEGKAVYNMTDTCVSPLTLKELIAMDHDHLMDDVVMDYGAITGDIRLKQEILKLYKTGSVDALTFTQGCLQGNEMVMYSLLEPGDSVITFVPGYQQFWDIPKALGCHVIEIPMHEENRWQIDIEDLRNAMQQKVKMIIINHPSNPTGSYFDKEILDEMIALAEKQNTWILSDEVYLGLNAKEESISDLYDRGISTCSFSKLFSLAGLRLGWVKGNSEIIHLLNVRRDYSIISTGALVDTLGLIAMQNKDTLLSRSRAIVKTNIEILENWLKEEKRASIVIPQNGTVGFLKYTLDEPSSELAESILETYGVFFVPGSCFDCEYHLRLGLTQNAEVFAQGLNLLSKYFDENSK